MTARPAATVEQGGAMSVTSPLTMPVTPAAPPIRATLTHAFFNQCNIILLGGTILFSWAIGSRIPMAVGVGAEVIWLAVGARSRVFWRWIEVQAQRREGERWGRDVTEMVGALAPDRATWLQRLRADLVALDRLMVERGAGPPSRSVDPKLKALWLALGRLAATQERLDGLASEDHARALRQEMERIHQALAEEKDVEARITLRQGLGLGQRGLKSLEKVGALRGALDTRASTLEMSLEQTRAQLVWGAPEDELALALDELLAVATLTGELEVEGEAVAALSRLGLLDLSGRGVDGRRA
jgi:hypothetical protein